MTMTTRTREMGLTYGGYQSYQTFSIKHYPLTPNSTQYHIKTLNSNARRTQYRFIVKTLSQSHNFTPNKDRR